MFKHIPILFFSLVLIGAFSSCSKQEMASTESSAQVDLSANTQFVPSSSIAMEHGMLSFDSKEDLDITLLEIMVHDRAAVDRWEQSRGFTSQQYMFNEVVLAEEAISDYYESLPESEQEYHRSQPEVNSEIYHQYLRDGIIKIVTDPEDGSEYFEYGVTDPSIAAVINKDGFVKAGDWIYQYTENAVKIILDGDFSKIPQIEGINTDYKDKSIVVAKTEEAASQNRNGSVDFSDHNSWSYPSNKKRVKVWLDGHSEFHGTPLTNNCNDFVNCTFTVRCQAQQKNFWGKWKYKSFMPSLQIDDGLWSYSYERYTNGYCGIYTTEYYNDLGTYSCTGCSSCPCPTPPHDAFHPTTNNGYYNLSPHGVWYANSSDGYFAGGFEVNYLIPATYDAFEYTLEP